MSPFHLAFSVLALAAQVFAPGTRVPVSDCNLASRPVSVRLDNGPLVTVSVRSPEVELPGAGPLLGAGSSPAFDVDISLSSIRIDFVDTVATYGPGTTLSFSNLAVDCQGAASPLAGHLVRTNKAPSSFDLSGMVASTASTLSVQIAPAAGSVDWHAGDYIVVLLQFDTLPSATDLFVDTFGDGIVNSSAYAAIGGATLAEFGGQLWVTPSAPGDGVLINNLFPPHGPPVAGAPESAWRYEIDLELGFAAPGAGTIQLTTLDPTGKAIDRTSYDNQSGQVLYSSGSLSGGVITRPVVPLASKPKKEKKREYKAIPPLCTGPRCDYGLGTDDGTIVIFGIWKLGRLSTALDDPPLDPGADGFNLGGVSIVTSEAATPFALSLVRLESGEVVGGLNGWGMGPGYVPTSGGDIVHIRGQGFDSLGTVQVLVDGQPVGYQQVHDDLHLSFQAPPHAQGAADVAVVTSDGSFAIDFEAGLRYHASAQPLRIGVAALEAGLQGQHYKQQLTATGGGGGTITYDIPAGRLPTGLSILGDTIAGTPIEPGVFPLYLRAQDATGEEDARFLLLDVAADCNGNGMADSDDVMGGGSLDANGNGVPDECEHDVRQRSGGGPLHGPVTIGAH